MADCCQGDGTVKMFKLEKSRSVDLNLGREITNQVIVHFKSKLHGVN